MRSQARRSLAWRKTELFDLPYQALLVSLGQTLTMTFVAGAISFVLGVKGAQLRGSLKEMLYTYTEGSTVDR